jgi:phosphoserine aminotransferase
MQGRNVIMLDKPAIRTKNPNFSCGPCTKRPGWSLENLSGVPAGRSHRASGPKGKLKDVIENHRALLGIPADYKIGIMPASDTGAFEAAMWSMLGARPVDVLAWESFWPARHPKSTIQMVDFKKRY